jgi:hypothetical protein
MMGTDNVDEDGFHTPFGNPVREAQWTRRRNLAEMLSRASRRYRSARSAALGASTLTLCLLLIGAWTYWYWGQMEDGTILFLLGATAALMLALYWWGACHAKKEELSKILSDFRGAYYGVSWYTSSFDGLESVKLEDQIPWPD